MKKLVILLTALALVFALSVTALADTTYYVKTNNGKSLRVRSGPGTDYDSIGTLSYGQEILVTGFDGNWAKIRWGQSDAPAGAMGMYLADAYVYKPYISRTKPGRYNPQHDDPKPANNEVKEETLLKNLYKNFKQADFLGEIVPNVNSDYVNVRMAPSKYAPLLKRYHLGDELRIIGEVDGWYQVYDEEAHMCGFVMKNFIMEVEIIETDEAENNG